MLKTPNSWKESPFPELYEKNPKTPLCVRLARGKHNSELILIHHLHHVSIPFIRSLSKGYTIRKIIGIPYSSFQSVVLELQKDFDVVVPDSLKEIPAIVKKEVESTTNKIIIEEIGGYTIKIANFLEKQPHVIGIVEDTKQGYWAWKKIPLKRLSVQSVACSKLKKAENCMVAKSIIDGTARFLALHNLPPLK
ncbi:hypothetical protein KJ972_02645 [Candidatus Micrarchaeota archaeon]|nr:hypothetical protein [Candidatus Micrarchaeota archaeon]